MPENGFVQIYRDILRSDDYLNASLAHRCLLIFLLERVVFEDCEQDDHGVMISLKIGQYMATIRQIAEAANLEKNDVERGLAKFAKLKILRLEVRHKKTVVTILWGLKFKSNETGIETGMRQERDTKQEQQEEKNNVCMFVNAHANDQKNAETQANDDSRLISVKSKKSSTGQVSAKLDVITKQLKEEGYTQEEINQAIGILTNSDVIIATTIINYLKGIIKKQKEQAAWTTKTKTKQKTIKRTSIEEFEKDKGFYLMNDTSETPLAIFARQNGLK